MKLNRMLPADLTLFQLQMETLAHWVRDNGHQVHGGNHTFPVVVLSSGNYGTCLKLLDYPGMVMKICRDSYDGYPAYIRAVVKAQRKKRWMPQILAHGGHEVHTGMFWCVMPEYHNPTGHQTGGGDTGWYDTGGDMVTRACSDANFKPASYVLEDYWSDTKRTVRREEPRDRKQRRFFRQVREFFAPLRKAGADLYMHPNNALIDGDEWIITDPIAGWCPHDKEKYEHANS